MAWRPMTPEQARDHLARLALSQNAAARLFRVNPRTFRRYLSLEDPQDVPRAIAIALELLTPARVRRLVDDDAGE